MTACLSGLQLSLSATEYNRGLKEVLWSPHWLCRELSVTSPQHDSYLHCERIRWDAVFCWMTGLTTETKPVYQYTSGESRPRKKTWRFFSVFHGKCHLFKLLQHLPVHNLAIAELLYWYAIECLRNRTKKGTQIGRFFSLLVCATLREDDSNLMDPLKLHSLVTALLTRRAHKPLSASLTEGGKALLVSDLNNSLC